MKTATKTRKSHTSFNNMIRENARLRRENAQLKSKVESLEHRHMINTAQIIYEALEKLPEKEAKKVFASLRLFVYHKQLRNLLPKHHGLYMNLVRMLKMEHARVSDRKKVLAYVFGDD